MNITFRPAIRSSAKLLVGLYSESGCGKTLSALLLARGFVGPNGTIGMIETESGRGEAYADTLPGGYAVLSLRENFSPEAYGEAISAAEQAKFGALIIDSASHEWEGVGGVLDMAAKNEEAGKKGLLIWQKPKISHAREFMLRLMQTSIPLVIVCMRAKYPMEGTGKDMKRSTVLEPKQSADILFEMMVHGWIDYDHNIHITKPRNKLEDKTGIITTVFADGKPITVETGERLAKWASGVKVAQAEVKTEAPVSPMPDQVKAKGAVLRGESPVAKAPPPAPEPTITGDPSEGDLSVINPPVKPTQEELQKVIDAFDSIAFTKEMLEKEYGKKLDDWTAEDLVEARQVYRLKAAERKEMLEQIAAEKAAKPAASEELI